MKKIKSLGNIFRNAWDSFEQDWPKYIGISAIITLIQFAIMFLLIIGLVLLQLAGIFGILPFFSGSSNDAGISILMLVVIISIFFLSLFLIFAASFFLNAWMLTALILAISKKIPKIATITDVLKQSWPKIWKIFLALILVFLIIGIGFLLLIIPGIIFAVWLSQTFFLLILKDRPITDAMKESKALIKGHFWRVLGYNLSAIVLMYVILIGVNIIPFLGTMIAPLLGIAFTPFLIAFQYQIYLELRNS